MTANFPLPLPLDGEEISLQEPVCTGNDRTQYGAVCWRKVGAKLEVLLITSRDTGRWVIPKGWPISGLTPEKSAAREAFEEAGVEGRVSATCMGIYSYEKGLDTPTTGPRVCVPCVVAVYPMQVKGLRDRFPERAERRRKWFSPKKAALKVAEPALQELLSGFEDYLSQGGGTAAAKAPDPGQLRGGGKAGKPRNTDKIRPPRKSTKA